MSLEDLADDPDGSLADLINTQLDLGASIIHLGSFGSVLGQDQIEVKGRTEETLAAAIERGRIVVQRYLRGHAVDD